VTVINTNNKYNKPIKNEIRTNPLEASENYLANRISLLTIRSNSFSNAMM
jgi:hypothetical protein